VTVWSAQLPVTFFAEGQVSVSSGGLLAIGAGPSLATGVDPFAPWYLRVDRTTGGFIGAKLWAVTEPEPVAWTLENWLDPLPPAEFRLATNDPATSVPGGRFELDSHRSIPWRRARPSRLPGPGTGAKPSMRAPARGRSAPRDNCPERPPVSGVGWVDTVPSYF